MKELLTIQVEIFDSVEVRGKTGSAKMIMFGGSCNCDLFTGEILPGGIDTQKIVYAGDFTLSARYILQGRDRLGNECRIFIENNGTAQKDGSLVTKPMIYTDSEELAFLERESLSGTISPREGGVTIHIFTE